jgi:hypothetical protein
MHLHYGHIRVNATLAFSWINLDTVARTNFEMVVNMVVTYSDTTINSRRVGYSKLPATGSAVGDRTHMYIPIFFDSSGDV